ncbi:MAG: family acetyltransferase, partial [Adhaeribacter sp.]|nr:family acetyltransferase [Adhaeribacter sp.]
PFPELKTERLLLRELEKPDWKIIFYLRSDEIINKFIKRPRPENKAAAIEFINKIKQGIRNNEWLYWCIILENNPQVIGTICLWHFSEDRKVAEVGYDLHPGYQKKGIMSEALNRVMEFGFNELKLTKIEAFTHKDNESSKRLLTRNNFHLVYNRIDEGNLDNVIFEIENKQLIE